MEKLSAYLPIDRHLALLQGAPMPDRSVGAVLFADISGFTPLTATLAHELGPQRGAEELTRQLNRVFGALIDAVHHYGGSVIGFSGDGMTCWFDEQVLGVGGWGLEETLTPGTDHPAPAAPRAAACALAMQQVMRRFAELRTPGGAPIALGIKVAVTAGAARRFLVGYPRIQTLEVLAGLILDRVALAEQQARRGEVILGAEVIAQLGDDVRILEWRVDERGERVAVVAGMARPVAALPWPELPELDAEQARDWLLPPVYQRLQRGEGQFLAELRGAVALFLKFTGIDYDEDDQAGAKLDAYIRWVQSTLAYYEGYLLQLTVGDKGSYLYIGFGAPLAHEDDPVRAVAAALALQALPPELSFIHSTRMGISQGQMHAGAYGGPTRRSYGVLGNEVNVAARLMSRAAPGQILMTARVAEAAAVSYTFDSLGLTALRGQPEPIHVLSLRGRRQPQGDTLKGRSLTQIVGREGERAILAEQLQALLNGQSACVVIEGDAGIGKSRLLAELLEQARALGIPRLLGAGDAIEQSTAYHAWRPIFRSLFGVGEMLDVAAAREHVLSQLPRDAHVRARAPLLNAVLPLNLPENELTSQMTGELRINNTGELLAGLLAAAPRPTSALLLVLEDAHWLDSASWALLAQVQRDVPNLLLVIATRPVAERMAGAGLADEFQRLLDAPTTQRIRLMALPPAEVLSLVCLRLDVARLPQPVAELILQRAEGHPFFSEELAYALRDAGLIQVRDGQCFVSAEAGDLRELSFPATIQGVITSRIDRLSPAQQLTLKVASVIGRVFAYRLLYAIHPIESDKPQLQDFLDALDRQDITPLEAPAPDLSYIFKHIITQEVAYHLLVFAQRRQLHQAVAAWYERAHTSDLSPFYPLLAHHWLRAEVAERAIEYLEKAGEQAYRQYANQEAIYFFGEALQLEQHMAEDSGPAPAYPHSMHHVTAAQLRRAQWQRYLGNAYVNLGRLPEGQPAIEETLRLLGTPIPTSRLGWLRQTLGQLRQQLWRRLRPGWLGTPPERAREILLEASRAYTICGAIYSISNELPKTLYALLAAFNTSEPAGPSQELALAAANMANVAGALGMHSLAQRYVGLAIETARQVDELATTAVAYSRLGIVLAGVGDWQRGEQLLTQSVAIAARLEDRRQWKESSSVFDGLDFYRGHYRDCLQRSLEIESVARQSNDTLYQSWGLAGQARAQLRLGDFAAAASLADQTLRLIAQAQLLDPGTSTIVYAVLSIAQARQGQLSLARTAADQALTLLRRHLSAVTGGVVATMLTAEAQLLVLEADLSAGTPALFRRAKTPCALLFKQIRTHPISRAPAWLHHGRYAWLCGRLVEARKHWRQALAVAESLQMPYELAMAHYLLARHLPPGDAEARAAQPGHIAQASEIFVRLGTAHDLARTRAP